jgi:excisionase family DNA binding protein
MSPRITVPAEPRWATLAQASDYSTIPVKTLRDWASRGRLPLYRFGPRQLRVDLNDIDALVRRVPTASGRAS